MYHASGDCFFGHEFHSHITTTKMGNDAVKPEDSHGKSKVMNAK
jgi:hypothetical protein